MLYLERIERLDPKLNAFRKVFADRALVDAQQADGRRGAGDERPLLGVPMAVKDVEDVTGERDPLGHRRAGDAGSGGQRAGAPRCAPPARS